MGKRTGGGGVERLKGRSRLLHNPEPEHNHWVAFKGWGSVKGGWFVFVCVGGGQEERQRRRESYPGTAEQFVTLEWLLSYPGGPLIAGEFSGRRVGNREGLGTAERGHRSWPTRAQAVRPLAGQAGGWRERKEAKKGVVGKPGVCQGSVFLGMLVKPAGEISV